MTDKLNFVEAWEKDKRKVANYLTDPKNSKAIGETIVSIAKFFHSFGKATEEKVRKSNGYNNSKTK